MLEIRSRVEEAGKVVSDSRTKEQEAMEKFRRSKLARDTFVQGEGSICIIDGSLLDLVGFVELMVGRRTILAENHAVVSVRLLFTPYPLKKWSREFWRQTTWK